MLGCALSTQNLFLSLPDLPRRLAALPKGFEVNLVAQGIHGLPETAVTIGGELTFSGEALHGFSLPDGIVCIDVVDDFGRQDEKTAIDPGAIAGGLFLETGDLDVLEVNRTEAAWGLGGGERRQLALLLVMGDQLGDVDVAEAISVGETEDFVAQIGFDTPQPPACHGCITCIDQRDAPGLGLAVVDFYLVVGHVEGDIRHVQEIVGEVLLDDIALVAAANDKVVNAVR